MPLYEYQCNKCDEILEEFDKITSTIKIIKCPLCGCDAKKIVSATQTYQPYTGARRQEETIERSTVVTKSINMKTKEEKVFTKPLKIEKE
jgi:putative FmdB family regulatory protein